LETTSSLCPPGVEVVSSYDRSGFDSRSIETLQHDLLEVSDHRQASSSSLPLSFRSALIPILTLRSQSRSFIPMSWGGLNFFCFFFFSTVPQLEHHFALGGLALAIGCSCGCGHSWSRTVIVSSPASVRKISFPEPERRRMLLDSANQSVRQSFSHCSSSCVLFCLFSC